MDIGDDYGVNVLCAKAVKSIDGFLGEARIACLLLKAVEVGRCGLDLQLASDQARANLTKSLGVQPVLAYADKVQLLVRERLLAGNARGKAGTCGHVPDAVAPFAQQRTLLVFVPAAFQEGRAHTELLAGLHARAIVGRIVGNVAIHHGIGAMFARRLDNRFECDVLAVVTAIARIGGTLGLSRGSIRSSRTGMPKLDALASNDACSGVPINGVVRWMSMLACGSSREQTAARKVLSTPPENPTAMVPRVRRCSTSATSFSCCFWFMLLLSLSRWMGLSYPMWRIVSGKMENGGNAGQELTLYAGGMHD